MPDITQNDNSAKTLHLRQRVWQVIIAFFIGMQIIWYFIRLAFIDAFGPLRLRETLANPIEKSILFLSGVTAVVVFCVALRDGFSIYAIIFLVYQVARIAVTLGLPAVAVREEPQELSPFPGEDYPDKIPGLRSRKAPADRY